MRAQPEILRYANHVADRFDLRRDIQFDTRVTRAEFDEAAAAWTGRDRPRRHVARAPFCVMATGCLSLPRMPEFPGLDSFHGQALPHRAAGRTRASTSRGQRVGVIGTGSSAIQAIPHDRRAGRPPVRVPAHAELQRAGAQPAARPDRCRASSRRTTRRLAHEAAQIAGRRSPDMQLRRALGAGGSAEERQRVFEAGWGKGGDDASRRLFNDLLTDRRANDTAAEFVRAKIRSIVKDPAVGRDAVRRRTTRSAPSASASTPTTTRPTTATT